MPGLSLDYDHGSGILYGTAFPTEAAATPMRNVDGWTRDELTDELAEGTGEGEAIWRDLLADASRVDLVNILAESDKLREKGKELV